MDNKTICLEGGMAKKWNNFGDGRILKEDEIIIPPLLEIGEFFTLEYLACEYFSKNKYYFTFELVNIWMLATF